MVKEYDAIFSLGSNCSVAHQIKRHRCRKCAGPLDWVVTQDAGTVVNLLRCLFSDYMLYGNLEILGEHNNCYKVRDKKYDIISVHDFEKDKPLRSTYEKFRFKMNRRINRFFEMVSSLDKILFIREHATFDEAIKIKSVIDVFKPNNNHELIMVNCHYHNHLMYFNCVNDIPFYDILQVNDIWAGYNHHWDVILNDVVLKSLQKMVNIDNCVEKIFGFYDEEEEHIWATDNCFFRIFNSKGKQLIISCRIERGSRIKIYNCYDSCEIDYNVVDSDMINGKCILNFIVPTNDCLVQFKVSKRVEAPNDSRVLGVCFFSIEIH